MRHSTGTPTKDEDARFDAMTERGCVACMKDGFPNGKAATEIHHFTIGNRRISHKATAALCPQHHRGEAIDGLSRCERLETIGPSWHKERRAFRARYGTDAEMVSYQNAVIGWEE